MRLLTSEKEQLEARVKRLETEQVKAEEAARLLQAETVRLRAVDAQLKQAQEVCEAKENEILRLMATNDQLETDISSKNRDFNQERAELRDQLETAACRNAEIEGECNVLRKKLADLGESMDVLRAELSQKVHRV